MDIATLKTEYGPPVTTWASWLIVVVVLLLAVVLAGWASRAVSDALVRARVDPTRTRFFSNVVRWLVLVLAVVGCLGVFGIETTSFAALLGAAGLAIGLGFQGSLSNASAAPSRSS
jgi:small conductance mechanosensitive channel